VFFSPNRAPNFPDVPTTEEATGHKWHKGVWRGFAAPKGLPKEIAAQYETAISITDQYYGEWNPLLGTTAWEPPPNRPNC
jgi:tripartite-type tricarboxylate transporter receptor subunit TctC